jgi:hypothetical protein
MRVLCLADDRRVAYLIKHVLSFEGYRVELGRPGEPMDGLADGVALIVAAAPLDGPATLPAPVVRVEPPVEPDALIAAVRKATAGSYAGTWPADPVPGEARRADPEARRRGDQPPPGPRPAAG